jgi:hypothetical protein
MALQVSMPIDKWDFVFFCLFAIGLSGMVAHFWIGRDPGMAWSAGCVYAVILYFDSQAFRLMTRSRSQGFVKLHIYFAFSSISIAATWGLMIAINKVHGFLPTTVASNLFAHAHLAAIGWVSMMVFGMSYRLLPMFLPGEPARGKIPWISPVFIEIGALGIFISLLAESKLLVMFAVVVVCGIFLFFLSAIRTALRRKPVPPPIPPNPDFAILQVACCFFWLVVTIILGLLFAGGYFPVTEIQWRLVYAFTGLVGFLSQMVIAMRPKILSIFTWYHAFQRFGNSVTIPRPVDMPVRKLQASTFLLWFIGIPLFASGIWLESSLAIRGAAILLLISLAASTLNEFLILRHIFKSRSAD